MTIRRAVRWTVALSAGTVILLYGSDSGAVEGLDPIAEQHVESLEELAVRLADCARSTADRGTGSAASSPDAPSQVLACPHLVYLWSPSMPLSMHGMDEITETAERMGVPLSILPAAALHNGAGDRPESDALRRGLVGAGATVHYPSIVVFERRVPRGNAIVGYKRTEGYRHLLEARLADLAEDRVGSPAPIGPGEISTAAADDRRLPPQVRVHWTYPLPSPPPGAFFRRIPTTRFIAFNQSGSVRLLHLETSERLPGPGYVDFVPSPDGKLVVTPGRRGSGLEFYVTSEVFRIARSGSVERFAPAYLDSQMADEYPSVGILAEDPEGRSTTYRVLISWYSGLAIRDYEARWGEDGSVGIAPVTPKMAGCPGMDLSTPIISKDGREIAARDEGTGTTKVFRLDGEGGCTELFDIGRQTSKVGFSEDGRLIAYSSPNGRGEQAAYSTTYVLDRQNMRTTRVPASESAGLVIPEVIGNDSLLILVREDPDSRATEFRLLCCAR